MGTISTTAALRCALRAIVSDSERYVAMPRDIATYRSLSFTIAYYRSQRAAQRSAQP